MYKNYKKIYFIIFLLILVTAFYSCKTSQEEQMFVFEFGKSRVNMDSFKSLVENVNGKPVGNFQIDEEGNLLLYVDDSDNIYFEQNILTEKLSFNRGIQKYLGDFKPELPSAKVAEEIALEFLKKNNFMPETEKELHLLHSGGLRADLPNGRGVIDKMITLTYGRYLLGVPVIGSGSKIVVNVGDQGEVTGLVHKWREISLDKKRPVKSEEIISKEEAEEIFNRTITTQFGKNASATINNIKLIYYDGDGRYIQPAYGIESTVKIELSKEKVNMIPYLSIVEALRDPPESINLLEVSKDALRLIDKVVDQKGKKGNKENMD